MYKLGNDSHNFANEPKKTSEDGTINNTLLSIEYVPDGGIAKETWDVENGRKQLSLTGIWYKKLHEFMKIPELELLRGMKLSSSLVNSNDDK